MTAPDGMDSVGRAIDGAIEISTPPPDPAGPTRPAPRRESALPEDCPVEPLGILDDVFFYLDASRQLRALPAREHSRLGLQALFGQQIELLFKFWPRLSQDDDGNVITTGW